MSVPINRQVGLARDPVAGGSDFDAVTLNSAGVIPAPTMWLPAKDAPSFSENEVRSNRNTEILGIPANKPEQPWTSQPDATIPCSGYFDIAARGMQQALGTTPTRTGVAPAALTDTFKAMGLGSAQADRFFMQFVRDSLVIRASGMVVAGFNIDLPADNPASIELRYRGLYYQIMSALAGGAGAVTVATPSFSLPSTQLRLAQVSAFIDGSITKMPNVISCGLEFMQEYDPKFPGGRNLVPDPSVPCNFVHFPAELKRKARRTITTRLELGETSDAEEIKKYFSRAEKIVLEIAECPIATTPAAVRMIRITTPGVVWTGGAQAMSATDDITSPFSGAAGYDDVSGYDIQVEVVHNTPTLFSA